MARLATLEHKLLALVVLEMDDANWLRIAMNTAMVVLPFVGVWALAEILCGLWRKA